MPADHGFSDVDLAGYLDEILPVSRSVEIEQALRDSSALRQRVAELIRQRDQGAHTIGEIWRRQRLSCPDRSTLGSYLLGILDPGHADYIRFHIHEIGCRLCEANLHDLELAASEQDTAAPVRRQRYFESSAGRLNQQSDG